MFDKLSVGSADEFHAFRKKTFTHLYFCPSCTKSFDSIGPAEACKYCGADATEIAGRIRHFCSTCDKDFYSSTRQDNCTHCGSKFLHLQTWDTLSRTDRMAFRMARFRKIFSGGKKKAAVKKDGRVSTSLVQLEPQSLASTASLEKVKSEPHLRGEELPTRR